MKKVNKLTNVKSAKVKIAEAKVRIAQRKLAEAKKALKEAKTKTINGYNIAELGKGRFIDLSKSVIEIGDKGSAWAVQLPAESKYAGKYLVWGYCDYDEYWEEYYKLCDEYDTEDEDSEDYFDTAAYWEDVDYEYGSQVAMYGEEAYAIKGYITDSIEGITLKDITYGTVSGLEFEEETGAGQRAVVFDMDDVDEEDDRVTNEYFISDPCRTGTAGVYFGKDAYRFAHNVNTVSFGIRPKLADDDDDED